MKARVVGVEFQGRWQYAATCPCGWRYARWDADRAFLTHADAAIPLLPVFIRDHRHACRKCT